jgi:hypothetical protein
MTSISLLLDHHEAVDGRRLDRVPQCPTEKQAGEAHCCRGDLATGGGLSPHDPRRAYRVDAHGEEQGVERHQTRRFSRQYSEGGRDDPRSDHAREIRQDGARRRVRRCRLRRSVGAGVRKPPNQCVPSEVDQDPANRCEGDCGQHWCTTAYAPSTGDLRKPALGSTDLNGCLGACRLTVRDSLIGPWPLRATSRVSARIWLVLRRRERGPGCVSQALGGVRGSPTTSG